MLSCLKELALFETVGKLPQKNFILVVLGIQVPFDNAAISAKAMYNACLDQD
jgi:hypothetical protein